MKKAGLNLSCDNYMRYQNLFRFKSKIWGEASFAVLLALFFFVWIKKEPK
jgi:hypothetical protein